MDWEIYPDFQPASSVANLEAPFSAEKINSAIFSFGQDKSLDRNGFPWHSSITPGNLLILIFCSSESSLAQTLPINPIKLQFPLLLNGRTILYRANQVN